jgi:hypothetical protein
VPRLDSTSAGSSGVKIAVNIFGSVGQERAHQIPNSNTCSLADGIICQAILGVDYETTFKTDRKGLIGAIQQLACGTGDHRKLGLKNLPVNLLALPKGRAEYYEDNPRWIVVPILPLKKTKECKSGEEYWVMVLACNKDLCKALVTDGYNGNTRCPCSWDDICTATELLDSLVQANVDALLQRPKDDTGTQQSGISPRDLFPTEAQCASENGAKEIDKRINVMKSIIETLAGKKNKYTVKVPCMKATNGDIGNLQVMKVLLTDHVPDPVLVATKASINCSARTRQKLLLACACLKNVDEEEDEAHAIARDFYEADLRAFRESELVGRQVMVFSVEGADDDLSADEELTVTRPNCCFGISS